MVNWAISVKEKCCKLSNRKSAIAQVLLIEFSLIIIIIKHVEFGKHKDHVQACTISMKKR